MALNELISQRFNELDEKISKLDPSRYQEWATNVLNLLENSLGTNSPHTRNFQKLYDNYRGWKDDLPNAVGVFRAAKEDYEGGYIFNRERILSGEIISDFVALAKMALQEGNKDVSAVLASAALEDTLKRYARENSLVVDDKDMQEVVGALKSKGLVSGAQKSLLDTMPKLRNYAMHANWDKLTNSDVGSIIGFIEQFLLSHFS